MTIRRRKRGGPHFAITCDAPACDADTDKTGLTGGYAGISAHTLRDRLSAHGWTNPPTTETDFCPVHSQA